MASADSPSVGLPSGTMEGRSEEARQADLDPKSSGGGSWWHLQPAPPPRALIHSLYQGKRAEEGRVSSPKGIAGVQSTSRSRPGPRLSARAAIGPVGVGHGARRDLAFFSQVRPEQGEWGPPSMLGGSGLPVARGSVPTRRSASLCAGHLGSKGSSAGWEVMESPFLK